MLLKNNLLRAYYFSLYYLWYASIYITFASGPVTEEIWEFQQAILSEKEREDARQSELILDASDPRNWILDTLDRLYCIAQEKEHQKVFP